MKLWEAKHDDGFAIHTYVLIAETEQAANVRADKLGYTHHGRALKFHECRNGTTTFYEDRWPSA